MTLNSEKKKICCFQALNLHETAFFFLSLYEDSGGIGAASADGKLMITENTTFLQLCGAVVWER